MQAQPFRELAPDQIPDNPFHLIGSDWMLITAGPPEAWNTMTASWGGLGILWNKPVSFCFVRPSRHTRGFMDRSGLYTLSFFGPRAPSRAGVLRRPLGPGGGQGPGDRPHPRRGRRE